VKFPSAVVDLFVAEHGSYALENTQTGQMIQETTFDVGEVLDMFLTEFGSYALDNGGFPAALRAL
jgi:hypothetical protein